METPKNERSVRGWIIAIVVAILLSVAVTWILGTIFRQGMTHPAHGSTGEGASASGCRMKCCGGD
ncbi:MAG TPA: hypothetical protein VGK27_13910 [Candidatus Deferrimicrobiaceae bacterium]|jgi:hypothetical protein